MTVATTVRLVVARHDEDVDWIRAVRDTRPERVHVTVYDKGTPLATPPVNADRHTLPNVGREAHTYLHHIVQHYDDLDDYTIFCQGRPTDHCARFVQRVAQFVDDPDDYVELTDQNMCNEPSWTDTSDAFPWLPLRETYEALFGRPAPHDHVAFAQGAMFGVSRERIRRFSKERYVAALDVAAAHPKAAWAYERLWRTAFS